VPVCVAVSGGILLVVVSARRVDQRGFGVVRSDAELKELMYELYEQEEVSGFVYVLSGALVIRWSVLISPMCMRAQFY